jgi:hypothetical protein
MSQCNEIGVYEPDERLSLSRPVKNWRGGPLGEIRLANLGTHWIWATSFQLWSGDCWGSSSPLMDVDHTPHTNHRAPTRETAIEAASARLRKSLSDRATSCRDARAVIEWLDTLVPDQLDLFGAAA